MALRPVKKLAVKPTDVGGLKSSRYEKLQVSYGSIEASSYSLLDTLVFADVPSQNIVRATIVAHAVTPIVLDIYPGTFAVNQPLTLGGLTSAVKISYVIEYVRGGGRVGGESYGDDQYGSGEALESGEGDLLTVIIGDVAGLTPLQFSSLSTTQISGLTPAQVVAITEAQAEVLTTPQIEALTESQYIAMEIEDFAALSASQLSKIEIEDIRVLSAEKLEALSTAQLAGFTPAQVAVLTDDQKALLDQAQLDALN